MRRGGTTTNKLYRMLEFYDYDDLDYFFQTLRENNLDTSEGLTWLDMQTRVNYVTGVDNNPQIDRYMVNYLVWYGEYQR